MNPVEWSFATLRLALYKAVGLRIVEREVLAEMAPDFLLGPRVCCFLRSANVVSKQRRDLCET